MQFSPTVGDNSILRTWWVKIQISHTQISPKWVKTHRVQISLKWVKTQRVLLLMWWAGMHPGANQFPQSISLTTLVTRAL